jgi:hypothetical protein
MNVPSKGISKDIRNKNNNNTSNIKNNNNEKTILIFAVT